MISTELLDKFKKLYEEKYNIILSEEEATEMATHFLNMMRILIKPQRPSEEEYSRKGKTK